MVNKLNIPNPFFHSSASGRTDAGTYSLPSRSLHFSYLPWNHMKAGNSEILSRPTDPRNLQFGAYKTYSRVYLLLFLGVWLTQLGRKCLAQLLDVFATGFNETAWAQLEMADMPLMCTIPLGPVTRLSLLFHLAGRVERK